MALSDGPSRTVFCSACVAECADMTRTAGVGCDVMRSRSNVGESLPDKDSNFTNSNKKEVNLDCEDDQVKEDREANDTVGFSNDVDQSRRGHNVWSEKERPDREHNASRQPLHSLLQPDVANIPLCGQQGARLSGNGGSTFNRPFASTALLDRDDSLLMNTSYRSLLASESHSMIPTYWDDCEAVTRTETVSSPVFIGNQNAISHCTAFLNPQVVARIISDNCHNLSSSSTSMHQPQPPIALTPSFSPAMELSRAKQEANITQMGGRKKSHDTLRPFPKVKAFLGSSKVNTTNIDSSFSGLTTKDSVIVSERKNDTTIKNELCHDVLVGSVTLPVKGVNPIVCDTNTENPAHTISCIRSYTHFGRMGPPPIWKEDDDIHAELKFTYRYPRLYLLDPADVINREDAISTGLSAGGDIDQKKLWWYRLSKRIDTTLTHVFDSHWHDMERSLSKNHCDRYSSNDTTSSESSSLDIVQNVCSTNDIVDFCLDQSNTPPRQYQKQRSKMKFSTCKKNTTPVPTSLMSVTPVNAWSEPAASTINVRGPTYSKDGVKVESETALFACLGVDSFVDGDDKSTSNSSQFLQLWNKGCDEVGMDKPPFLLVINFVVPWGNFQTYSFRPDADDGPFSSIHKDRPSEKAWKAFINGNTEYRNKCLKFIPRACAGPWVVRKMIGSTPVIIGTKVPVFYKGSIEENYLEITMDVTKGPAFGNTVANTVVGKSDLVTVDLGFLIEGQDEDGHLPEQLLSVVRLHHLEMKSAVSLAQWKKEVQQKIQRRS